MSTAVGAIEKMFELVHFHDLRHRFANQLVVAGMNLTTIKELLGHKTPALALLYPHFALSYKAHAIKVLYTVVQTKSKEMMKNNNECEQNNDDLSLDYFHRWRKRGQKSKMLYIRIRPKEDEPW